MVCLMVVQPVLGWLHHRYFVKNQTRGLISQAHIWYGRALLILGAVNGGLGLRLAKASRAFMVAYSVVAGIVFFIYIASALFGEYRRRKRIEQEKSF